MKKSKRARQVHDYDTNDTSTVIDAAKRLHFEDLGVELPKIPPTQVVSIRLPSELLNQLKAYGSQRDIPYQALIKLFLAQSLEKARKKVA